MKREEEEKEEEVAPEGSAFLQMASLNNPELNHQLETSEKMMMSVIYVLSFLKTTPQIICFMSLYDHRNIIRTKSDISTWAEAWRDKLVTKM